MSSPKMCNTVPVLGWVAPSLKAMLHLFLLKMGQIKKTKPIRMQVLETLPISTCNYNLFFNFEENLMRFSNM